MTESKLTISWEKEGHIFCDFRFSSSFQKIDMILLTRPEGCLIGRIRFLALATPKNGDFGRFSDQPLWHKIGRGTFSELKTGLVASLRVDGASKSSF